MASSLGLIEINCDAPSYAIVRACAGAGFQSPLDVRWCHRSRFLQHQPRRHSFWRFLWLALLGVVPDTEERCSCGATFPSLAPFLLRYPSQGCYFLGQCCRCRTIFWEEG